MEQEREKERERVRKRERGREEGREIQREGIRVSEGKEGKYVRFYQSVHLFCYISITPSTYLSSFLFIFLMFSQSFI